MSKIMQYDPAANPGGAFVPGVPNADLTAKDWKALPKHLQARAAATGWWSEVDPDAPPAPKGAAAKKPDGAGTVLAGTEAP